MYKGARTTNKPMYEASAHIVTTTALSTRRAATRDSKFLTRGDVMKSYMRWVSNIQIIGLAHLVMLLSYSRDVGEVRRVKPGDADDLDEVFRQSWSEGFSDIIDGEDLENIEQGRCVTEDDIQQRMRQDGILTLVYIVDRTVLGQGRIAWSDDTTENYTDTDHGEAELRSMYVHPNHWNEGIGSAIVEALVERCPVEPSALKAETYEGSDAAEFYRSKGFKVVQRSAVESTDTKMSRDYSAVVLERS